MSKNDYTHLLEYARRHLSGLDFGRGDGQRRFLTAACEELNVGWEVVENPWHDRDVDTSSAAYDFIDMLANADPNARDLPVPDRKLWVPLMRDWPLGRYGEALAQFLPDDMRSMSVLEIGAGVGNTTTLVRDRLGDRFSRTDLFPKLLVETEAPGDTFGWNFDEPFPRKDTYDLIFGTNALHCATDPAATFDQLIRQLRPGGQLMISEGCPYTPDPWALTAACGLIDGWWDKGGFLAPYNWAYIGFQNCRPIYEGAHRVGAIYTYTAA